MATLIDVAILHFEIVGATGFEPAAAWSQTRSATGLRYTPLQFSEMPSSYLRVQRYNNFPRYANFSAII